MVNENENDWTNPNFHEHSDLEIPEPEPTTNILVSRNNHFPRSKDLPLQSPTYWVSQKDRYLRQLLIQDIEEITQRPLLVYFTNPCSQAQIEEDDIKKLEDMLEEYKDREIDLLLESDGGSIDCTKGIIEVLKNKTNNLRIIITSRVRSTGSLIALAAKEILMGTKCELGPIDPYIRLDNALMPANFILSMEEASPTIKALAEQLMLQAEELGISVLKEGIFQEKDEKEISRIIRQDLSAKETYFSHGSLIDNERLLSLGIKSTVLSEEDELWKRLWLLYCIYEYDCRANDLAKIFEGSINSQSLPLIASKEAEPSFEI